MVLKKFHEEAPFNIVYSIFYILWTHAGKTDRLLEPGFKEIVFEKNHNNIYKHKTRVVLFAM